MTTSSNGHAYFNLHTTGLGYVNRIREVKPRKGAPFLACDINALSGPSDDVEYCRFDVKVSGAEAQHLIRRCEKAVKAQRKVLIGFRLGDLWIDQFTYPADCRDPEKAGQPGVSLKARLLFVPWIKIDTELVYKAEPKAPNEAAHGEPPASEPAADTIAASGSPPTPDDACALAASALSVVATAEVVAAAEAASVSNAASGASF